MSSDDELTGLRRGLPWFLAEEPERLNNLLGLNRKERLRVTSLVPRAVRLLVKAELRDEAKPPQPGELDRRLLVWQYADPDFRRMVWEDRLRHGPRGPASLEALVLADFMEPEPDAKSDAATESTDTQSESERIAARAWSHTRERLEQWESLDEEGRAYCVVRAFAVATLRDDPEALAEAVRVAPDLHTQFGRFLEDEEDCEEVTNSVGQWIALCEALANLAQDAVGPPVDVDRLDEIAEIVERLRDLAPAVGTELVATEFEELFSVVQSGLDRLRADETFAWLDAELRQNLEGRWRARAGSLTLEQFQAEWDRFIPAVTEAEHRVCDAADAAAESEQRVLETRKRPGNVFGRRQWAASLAELQAEERACEIALAEAQLALLAALSPLGEPFDPDEASGVTESPSAASTPCRDADSARAPAGEGAEGGGERDDEREGDHATGDTREAGSSLQIRSSSPE